MIIINFTAPNEDKGSAAESTINHTEKITNAPTTEYPNILQTNAPVTDKPIVVSTDPPVTGNIFDNPEYNKIFLNANITHTKTFFGMETANFVFEQDEFIICEDYGFEGDVVKQWCETIYIPVSGKSDEVRAELEKAMKAEFASLEELNCCTIVYNMGEDWFEVIGNFTDVDKAENYGELYDIQYITVNSFVSMHLTEESLLEQGYVKK